MVAYSENSAPRDRFYIGATAILVLGIVLRQWNLGAAPFHPDEAIHAFFAGGFKDYKYDPVYHGPLLYHLVAAVFGLAGAIHHDGGQYDYTARLVPSLLGIGLLGSRTGADAPVSGQSRRSGERSPARGLAFGGVLLAPSLT